MGAVLLILAIQLVFSGLGISYFLVNTLPEFLHHELAEEQNNNFFGYNRPQLSI